MPKTTKSKFSLNKLNYYAMFDTGDKLDHICVMLEKIVDDLDGQDVVKVEIDNKDNTLVRIFADQERDQLREENARLREQLRWHDAKKEPPKKSGHYIVMTTLGLLALMYYKYTSTSDLIAPGIVSKWCYIPDDNQGTDCTPEGK